MAYSKNPHLPKVRAQAVRLVQEEAWSMRKVARYVGVQPSTVSRWMKRAPLGGMHTLPTKSSRPHTSPSRIDYGIEERIVALRKRYRRCPQVLHHYLLKEGIDVSFSTVYRVLKRHELIKRRSPWKKFHLSGNRPMPAKPGMLVQTDTIHIMQNPQERMYIYTLIDCFSRLAYARATTRITSRGAGLFVYAAQKDASFPLSTIQSDHGPEFTTTFTTMVHARGIHHRHSRVRQPNDNAHVERFNRTIQDELADEIKRYKTRIPILNTKIKAYMHYYNTERLHMGINYETPLEVLRRS